MTRRSQAEIDVLARQLREHVDALASLEARGLGRDALAREQVEIKRLRKRIAVLVEGDQVSRSDSAT